MRLNDTTDRVMRSRPPKTPRGRSGGRGAARAAFTIIEMLVVVSIIVLLMAVTFPVISSVTRSTRRAAAVNSVGVAVSAARSYAMREIGFGRSIGDNPLEQEAGDGYSGSAALFTPAGEIRIVENFDEAVNGSNASLELAGQNGYQDIPEVEYVRLPRGTGVVGITRGTGGLELLPPPFAIRFNEHGHLMVASVSNDDMAICYDSNFNGQITTTVGRPNDYDVDDWDPDTAAYAAARDDSDPDKPGIDTGTADGTDKQRMAFERIEPVMGVMVYSKQAFLDAELDWAASSDADIATWLAGITDGKDNSRTLIVSRYTGAIMREKFVQ